MQSSLHQIFTSFTKNLETNFFSSNYYIPALQRVRFSKIFLYPLALRTPRVSINNYCNSRRIFTSNALLLRRAQLLNENE